jgi:uncharacterized protein
MAQDWVYDRSYGESAADAPVNARAAFIRKTYLTLFGAVLAFTALTAALVSSGVAEEFVKSVFVSRGAIIGLMVAFIVGGMAAQAMARSQASPALQWTGLVLYTLLEVAIFLPILVISETLPQYAGKNLALQAGICTLMVFGALTFTVVASGKDFSFLRPFLIVASFAALGFVLVSVFLGGPSLGLGFTLLMLLLSAGYVLYDTSNVMKHYPPGSHVAAALELFASVTMMFYYMLRLFMSQNSSRE